MYNKALSAALVLAAAKVVVAQTFTDCQPLEKTCPAEPAQGKNNVSCDWTKGKCDAVAPLPYTNVAYDDQGMLLSIKNKDQAPTLRTNKYIFFGEVEVVLRACEGQGVVTSAVLQSADLDEIDWEWVGGDNAQVQTNYFGKGDTTTYDRGAYHPVNNPIGEFHTYHIKWTKEQVAWSIDGAVVRTLNYADAKGGSRYPQTPMEIKLGTWVAGLPDAPKGTVEWAGGFTDFSKAPFNAWYKSVSIIDYAGGDGPTTDSIKEYVYGDKTGSWESIKVVKGDGSVDESSSSAAPTKTSSATKTSTKESESTVETESVTKSESKSSSAKMTTITTPVSSSETNTPTSSSTEESTSSSGSSESAPALATPTGESGASKGLISLGSIALAGLVALVL